MCYYYGIIPHQWIFMTSPNFFPRGRAVRQFALSDTYCNLAIKARSHNPYYWGIAGVRGRWGAVLGVAAVTSVHIAVTV